METFFCDNCGAALQDRACKLICPKCHFYYSCSDYIYPPAAVESRLKEDHRANPDGQSPEPPKTQIADRRP